MLLNFCVCVVKYILLEIYHFNPFKVYNSAALSIFSVTQPALLSDFRTFHHPKRNPASTGSHTPSYLGSEFCIPPVNGRTAHFCLPFPRFLKGLPVRPAPLSDELKAALSVDPTPGGIKYIIATQVRPGTGPQPRSLGAPMAQYTRGGPCPAHWPQGFIPGVSG